MLEHVLNRADAHGEQSDADVVDRRRFLLMERIVHVRSDHHGGENADRQIDIEDPRPAIVVREPTPERRTDCWAHHDAESEQRHRHARLLSRERLEQDRLRYGHQRSTAASLHDAPKNQRS